jgi:hypothetical protein
MIVALTVTVLLSEAAAAVTQVMLATNDAVNAKAARIQGFCLFIVLNS